MKSRLCKEPSFETGRASGLSYSRPAWTSYVPFPLDSKRSHHDRRAALAGIAAAALAASPSPRLAKPNSNASTFRNRSRSYSSFILRRFAPVQRRQHRNSPSTLPATM